jgi:hypothetical protein
MSYPQILCTEEAHIRNFDQNIKDLATEQYQGTQTLQNPTYDTIERSDLRLSIPSIPPDVPLKTGL